ncbi:uncharacterized protein LOC124981952 [Sciurus carolinensis]|uniref:uncharacterized protein LOC124981952 n=1 Tax=Sciurus carolinensis TaxID=30640 RepID=UPI001FB3F54D|nr:uncharacterized protein LOC124981952 [Sciurus carolinensis]XP_047403984.1 uncharacterized protein LOC124981952 [Sciurus carolinensis]XP_047403985.1 uncharacterized protein LOC124981952 [Sciurus carolinensis]XP_047403986.1 uncharacterized protein LOC124981952 [Sciurus carolinensis]XP_047403987.1 uncharacterized protein LOC124981952 [Sciurus carolinensis]
MKAEAVATEIASKSLECSAVADPSSPSARNPHIPNQSAIRPRCWDPGGRISRGFRPGGNLSTKRRRKENARALERVGEKPSLSGHVQAASRLVEELRPGAAADRSLFSPLPPSWRNWGRGGDVSAPPSPQLSSQRGVLGLGLPPWQLRLPAPRLPRPPSCCSGLCGRSLPLGEMSALLHPAESQTPPSARVPLTQHLSGPRPSARTSGADKPAPAAFPTARTAGDALPLLQLKFVAT